MDKEFKEPIKGIFKLTASCPALDIVIERIESHDIKDYLDPKMEYDFMKREFVNVDTI